MEARHSRRWTAGLRLLALAVILIGAPGRGRAEPVVLKFFTSDRSAVYRCQVKPFVDAVNAEGAGLVKIRV